MKLCCLPLRRNQVKSLAWMESSGVLSQGRVVAYTSSDSHVYKQHKSMKRDTRSLQVSYDHRSYERKLSNCI